MTAPKLTRRSLAPLATGLAVAARLDVADARSEEAPRAAAPPGYAPPGYPTRLSAVPFGSHSHWLQPWRTLPAVGSADRILDGVGVMVRGWEASQETLDLLHAHGFRHVRTEIGWTKLDFAEPARVKESSRIGGFLRRCQQAGLRPLILLNANDGSPTPVTVLRTQLAGGAEAGARSLVVRAADGIVPMRTGFQEAGSRTMASTLVTAVEGDRLSLSRPLAHALPAGAPLELSLMLYEPFGPPGAPATERTMLGWLAYVDAIGDFVDAALETQGGYDLEIWNELTFGSKFLSINNYFDPKFAEYDGRQIWSDLVRRTAEHVERAGGRFRGVRLADGFGATIPWPASSAEPSRVSAISRHPYPPQRSFPRDEQHGTALDAAGRPTTFVPTYDVYLPEYFAGTAIQTEMTARDLTDAPDMIYRVAHGRLARASGPVDTWLTEIGSSPKEHGIEDPQGASRLATLFALRALLFHLAIGVERVYLFEAVSKPGELGLLDAGSPERPTPAVQAVQRTLAWLRAASGPDTPANRPALRLTLLRPDNDAVVFAGSGRADEPSLMAADTVVLMPLPSARDACFLVYAMTRDVRVPMAERSYDVRIEGLAAAPRDATLYDPAADRRRTLAVRVDAGLPGISVPLTDTPRLLRIGR